MDATKTLVPQFSGVNRLGCDIEIQTLDGTLSARRRYPRSPGWWVGPERLQAAAPVRRLSARPSVDRTRDLVGYESALEMVKDLGVVRFPGIDLDVTRRAHERYSCVADDFGSVCGETTWTMGFARDGWTTETITRTVLTSSPTEFSLFAQLDAYEGSERGYADSLRHTIPRDHV